MKKPALKSHRDIILLWGKRAAYAAAISVNEKTAQSHYDRDSIGQEHLQKVVAAAAQIGHEEITLELLHDLKPRRRKRPLADAAVTA